MASKVKTGLRAVPKAEVRKAMKAANVKNFTKDSVILVAKELGFDVKTNKKLINSFRMTMRHSAEQDD